MAQGIKYQIPFRSRSDVAYVVNIYQRDYTGTATLLSGASSSPIITEETSDTDLLTPIRTQSGYLKIVTSRDVWLDIINNCSMVKLMRGSVVEWGGYINKEAFNGDAFEPVKEYQIPIHCILSHLQSFRFVVSPFNSPTFAQILHEAFSHFPELYPDEMAWVKMLSSTAAPKFLECRFQRSNFYDESEKADADEVVKSESTYYDVISEICKYFGIVLCVQRTRLLFSDGYGGDCYLASTQDLVDIETDGAASVHVLNEIVADNNSLHDMSYLSADNQESILQPVREVKIEGDINPYDDFDGTYPKKTVDNWIDAHTTRIWFLDSSDVRHYHRDFDVDLRFGHSPTHLQEFDQYENNDAILKCFVYPDGLGDEYNHGSVILSTDECPESDVPNKIDYNWKNRLAVSAYSYNFGDPSFGIYGKHDIHLAYGSGAIRLFYETAKTYPSLTNKWVWRLRIGNMYWNGSIWTSQPSTFSVGWKATDPIVECETNRQLGDGYDGKTGLLIPISTSLSGRMSLEMMQTDVFNITNVELETLEVEYVRKNNQKNGTDTTIEETATTGVDSLEDYSQSCVFATSPKVNGYGAVLDFNGAPLTSYAYRNLPLAPERHRLNIVSAIKSRPQSVLDIDISDDDSLVDRYETVRASGVWPDYSILSLSHDWAESKIKVKLIQTSSV